MKRLEDRPWWPELVSLKDTLSLRELAERFGAAPAAIANALRRNNLERAPAPPGPRAYRDPAWRAAADAVIAETAEAPAAPAAKSSAKSEKATTKAGKAAKPAKAAKAAKPAKAAKAPAKETVKAEPKAEPKVEAKVEAAPAPKAEPVAAPAPVAAPVVATAVVAAPAIKQVRGYRAMINGEGYVIVAGNVAEAAAVACASGQGDVVSIELLGLALSL